MKAMDIFISYLEIFTYVFYFFSILYPSFSAIQIFVGFPFIIILLCLYFVPIGHYSPCVQDQKTLGPKPLLIAHRGAAMVGIDMVDIAEYRCAWNM